MTPVDPVIALPAEPVAPAPFAARRTTARRRRPPIDSAPPSPPAAQRRDSWLLYFVLFEIVTQVLLLIPALSPVRVIFRTAAFAASLTLVFVLPRKGKIHPCGILALAILGILVVEAFHPETNSLIAATAAIALYAAIFAPLFWMPRVYVDRNTFCRALQVMLWGLYASSAFVGVLQVHFPGRFQPPISAAVSGQGRGYVESLKIHLTNGAVVFRPMGLTDQPGGAAPNGLYAIVLGLGLFCTDHRLLARVAYLASLPMSLFCIYLAQQRSTLLMAGVCAFAFIAILAWRGDLRKATGLVGVVLGVIILSFLWATAVGGDAVAKRLNTLTEGNPKDVYYNNRGKFLDETVNVLMPKYPLGAGLGRWGMTHSYFANKDPSAPGMIWAEIQWTGWLLDGGIPMMLAYTLALLVATYTALRIALDRRASDVGVWAAIVCAYNIGAMACTFNNPLFMGQEGLLFWLLNAGLYAAYVNTLGHLPPPLSAAWADRPWPHRQRPSAGAAA